MPVSGASRAVAAALLTQGVVVSRSWKLAPSTANVKTSG